MCQKQSTFPLNALHFFQAIRKNFCPARIDVEKLILYVKWIKEMGKLK